MPELYYIILHQVQADSCAKEAQENLQKSSFDSPNIQEFGKMFFDWKLHYSEVLFIYENLDMSFCNCLFSDSCN